MLFSYIPNPYARLRRKPTCGARPGVEPSRAHLPELDLPSFLAPQRRLPTRTDKPARRQSQAMSAPLRLPLEVIERIWFFALRGDEPLATPFTCVDPLSPPVGTSHLLLVS